MIRPRPVVVVLAILTAGASFVSLPGAARGQSAPDAPRHRRHVCGPPAHHHARCHAEVVTGSDDATPQASTTVPSSALKPAGLQSAYKLPSTTGTGKTIAIVDAYDNPSAESDLGKYRTQFGLPACTTANACFRKVNQSGAASPLPSGSIGWGQEIAIDLDMASAICPNCKLLLVEASSNSFDDLAAAVDRAATMGADAISNSWGSSEFSDETSFESHFNHPGRAITASSGDDGYGVSYPAASRYVTAVGGTRLTSNTNVARQWTEAAWSGAGSGCSEYIAKPSWQTDTGCSTRTVADVAAVADPSTGVAVYDSYGSSGGANWYVFGGTSVGAPIIAATYALGGATSSVSDGRLPYSHRSSLFDITSGSNGSCSPAYLCQSVAGYDGPTGLGTPNGTVAFGGSGAAPPSVPSAPRNLIASAPASGHGVKLTWQAPANPGSSPVTGYRVFRSRSTTPAFLVAVGNVLTYTDTKATPGVSYFYWVKAVNSAGVGPYSNRAWRKAS